MEENEFFDENNEDCEPIGVYIKVNENCYITDVNSDVFIKDFTGWQKIDEGFGDKFAHAQSNYFEMPLIDDQGKYQIKYCKD